MGNLPDVSGLFYLAMFGLFSAAVTFLGVAVGMVYFVASHVQITW